MFWSTIHYHLSFIDKTLGHISIWSIIEIIESNSYKRYCFWRDKLDTNSNRIYKILIMPFIIRLMKISCRTSHTMCIVSKSTPERRAGAIVTSSHNQLNFLSFLIGHFLIQSSLRVCKQYWKMLEENVSIQPVFLYATYILFYSINDLVNH